MMKETKDKEVQEFIQKKIESNNWFKNANSPSNDLDKSNENCISSRKIFLFSR